ncbi:hypothetical protein F5Y03DRAFT_384428 [Xylaria venustula]|nr:hypothetical protein F5Y03DRAFT_384428 [Xylaria venustula]
MKSTSILALSYTFSLTTASTYPELQWDPATISTCISPEEFHAWNPSVGLDCKPWDYQSYCILTRERLASLTSTTTTAQATITTTKTTSTTHAPSPTAWNALGCYTDDDAIFPVLEMEKCEDACWKASNDIVLYAGVKHGNQCWCGSFVGGQTSRKQADCNVPCAGNKAVTCGGKDRIGVFEPVTTTAEPPAAFFPMPIAATSTTRKKRIATCTLGMIRTVPISLHPIRTTMPVVLYAQLSVRWSLQTFRGSV